MVMRFVDKLKILNMIPQQGGLLLVSAKDSPDITETERRISNLRKKTIKQMLYISVNLIQAEPLYPKFLYMRIPILDCLTARKKKFINEYGQVRLFLFIIYLKTHKCL